MNISDDLQSYLLLYTYPAQFARPMEKDIDNVFTTLIYPETPFVRAGDYLEKIQQLLSQNVPLGDLVPSTAGRSDKEVRTYLKLLALEIEHRFPNFASSGSHVKDSGCWQCYEHSERKEIFQKGDLLPTVNDENVVWERLVESDELNASECLRNEFNFFYERKIISGVPDFSDVEPYAQATASRLRSIVKRSELMEVSGLLKEMTINASHPLVRLIESESNFIWTNDEKRWKWFQDLSNRIALLLV